MKRTFTLLALAAGAALAAAPIVAFRAAGAPRQAQTVQSAAPVSDEAGVLAEPDAKWLLTMREDVQTDLKLAQPQRTKLESARQDLQDAMRQAFQASDGDMDAVETAMQKATGTFAKAARAALTADQARRVVEIDVQLHGVSTIQDPDVQKLLGLSPAQVAKVAALLRARAEADKAIGARIRDQELDPQVGQVDLGKNATALDAAFDKLLTVDQRAKLKALGGRPFKATPDLLPDVQGGIGGA